MFEAESALFLERIEPSGVRKMKKNGKGDIFFAFVVDLRHLFFYNCGPKYGTKEQFCGV